MKSPNLTKIFHGLHEIPNTEFAKLIATIDEHVSRFADYDSERYENGTQTLFYKYGPYNITITIDDNDEI